VENDLDVSPVHNFGGGEKREFVNQRQVDRVTGCRSFRWHACYIPETIKDILLQTMAQGEQVGGYSSL
jgi:hypothetical protein